MVSMDARAPSCRCRTGVTIAVPSASFRTAAAIRARYPWARWSLRCAGSARGDIIAGFPTETEDMFARSLDLVDACGLTHLHVFPFSPRPGTPAARMPQINRNIIKERARRLREKGEAALHRHLEAQVGARRQVLIESGELGRTEHFTRARLSSPIEPGTILDVTVIGHDGGQLLAA